MQRDWKVTSYQDAGETLNFDEIKTFLEYKALTMDGILVHEREHRDAIPTFSHSSNTLAVSSSKAAIVTTTATQNSTQNSTPNSSISSAPTAPVFISAPASVPVPIPAPTAGRRSDRYPRDPDFTFPLYSLCFPLYMVRFP
jgi:hypothetical protein